VAPRRHHRRLAPTFESHRLVVGAVQDCGRGIVLQFNHVDVEALDGASRTLASRAGTWASSNTSSPSRPVTCVDGEVEVTKRDEEHRARVLEQLRDLLAITSRVLPGSLVERTMICGKASCRCHDDPPHLQGPYVQWSYTVANKRFTRWLTPEQQERYRGRIEVGKQLRELVVKELEWAEVFSVERAERWGR
jgi:hypothetical protein